MGRISKVVQIFPNMTNHLILEMQKIGMRVGLYMLDFLSKTESCNMAIYLTEAQ
jgi:hypothetical protein